MEAVIRWLIWKLLVGSLRPPVSKGSVDSIHRTRLLLNGFFPGTIHGSSPCNLASTTIP